METSAELYKLIMITGGVLAGLLVTETIKAGVRFLVPQSFQILQWASYVTGAILRLLILVGAGSGWLMLNKSGALILFFIYGAAISVPAGIVVDLIKAARFQKQFEAES